MTKRTKSQKEKKQRDKEYVEKKLSEMNKQKITGKDKKK